MKITIYGTGYVGLVTGACLAEAGHHVLCMDVDTAKIEGLRQGVIPIFEPGLETLVKTNAASGHLAFTTDVKAAVSYSELQLIAVGTPPDEDGSADLQYVRAVAGNIAAHMTSPRIIVTKSTVPVGTADLVKDTVCGGLADREVIIPFHVVSNPEFLKEGAAVSDFMKPDRIIVGTNNEDVKAVMHELYAPFNRNHDRLMFMDVRSAELTKYAANAMLATRISFMNEMANIAEELGADIEDVRQGIGSDPRIGYQFIYPGCGYGGSCFPKDVQALYRTARQSGYHSEVLAAVEAVNQRQKSKLVDLIKRHFNDKIEGLTFALWGLAFKPKTDDMREAPSRVVMEALWAAGAKVQAYDPEAMAETKSLYGDEPLLTLCQSKEAALDGANALIICTEWQHFRAPDFGLLLDKLKDRVIFDGRNLYEPELMKEKGIAYYAIGRGDSIKLF